MQDREVKKVVCEELCVIKLCVKDVCDTIIYNYVCERLCTVTHN